ncbi:MAG TPA: hypothetical protein VFE51_10895 [Verrucomicrobiae bacterium]|nr:hypothetical protein [Verrucomicrobiae bacterium]
MKVRLAVALLALILLALAFIFHRPPQTPPEPTVHGISLTEFVLRNGNTPQTRAAIRAIGTNALPCLLAWLSADPEENRLRGITERLATSLPSTPTFQPVRVWALSDPAVLHFEMTGYVFNILGPDAAPAIPNLEGFANDARGRRSAYIATYILAGIGPQAIPALQRIAANAVCPTRNEAAREVKQILTQSASGNPVAH